jgi:hypothetical protein
MSIHLEIDDTLRRLGSVEPPSGLERRVNLRLQIPRRRFSLSMVQAVSACAVAASVALSAVVLNPALHNFVFRHHATSQTMPLVNAPRVVAPAPGGFGTASAVHVPVEPVPVQPTPVNQGGRGRSRSGRAVLPTGATTPLPRGVAAPNTPVPAAPSAGAPSAPDSTH